MAFEVTEKKPLSIDAHLMRDYGRTERKYLVTSAGRLTPRTSIRHRLSKLNEPGGMFSLSGGSFSPGVKVWAALFVVLALAIGGFAWVQEPSNGLFHSEIAQHYCSSTVFTNCVADPANLIGDFAGNNMNGYNSQNTVSSSGFLTLQPNSTFPAIAVSKSQADLSSANGREVVFDTEMGFGATVNTGTFDAYQYYLTTNSNISRSSTYNPLSDPAVVFDVGMGNCGMNGCEYDVFMSNNQTGTLTGQNYGGCLPNSSTVNGCPTVAMPSGAGDAMDAVFLNYTGVNGATNGGQNGVSCAAIGNTAGGSNRCSSLDFNGNNFFTFVGQSANTWRTYPRLPLSRYYVGFFVAATSKGTINTNFIATTNLGFGTTDAMIIYNFLPAATVTTPPSPIQGGGFFQPLINLLVQAGVFILSTILGFAAYIWTLIQAVFSQIVNILAPALATLVTIITGVIKAVLDAIGNALGLGAIGTNLFTFLGDIGAFFTTFFGNSLAQLSSFITFLTNGYATVSASFGTYWTDLVNWTSGIKDFLAGLWVIAGQLFTISFAFMFSGWLLYGAKKFSDSVGEGMEWFNLTRQFIMLGVAITLFVFTMTVHYVLTPAMNMIQSVGEAKKTAEPDIEIGGTGVG